MAFIFPLQSYSSLWHPQIPGIYALPMYRNHNPFDYKTKEQPSLTAKRMRLQDDIAINSDYAYVLQPSKVQHNTVVASPGLLSNHVADPLLISPDSVNCTPSAEEQPSPPAKRMRLQDDITISSDYDYVPQPPQDQHNTVVVSSGLLSNPVADPLLTSPGNVNCIPQSGLDYFEEQTTDEPAAIGISGVQPDITKTPLQGWQQLQQDEQPINAIPSFKSIKEQPSPPAMRMRLQDDINISSDYAYVPQPPQDQHNTVVASSGLLSNPVADPLLTSPANVNCIPQSGLDYFEEQTTDEQAAIGISGVQPDITKSPLQGWQQLQQDEQPINAIPSFKSISYTSAWQPWMPSTCAVSIYGNQGPAYYYNTVQQPAPPAKRMRLQDDIAVNSDYAYTMQPPQEHRNTECVSSDLVSDPAANPLPISPGDIISTTSAGFDYSEVVQDQSTFKQPAIGISVVQPDGTTNPLQGWQELHQGDQTISTTPSFKPISAFAGTGVPTRRRGRPAKNSTCTICNKKFGSSYKLKLHMFAHTGEKPFLCDVCGMGFNNGPNRNQHLRVHSAGTFHCPLCSKVFRHAIDRLVHVLTQACARAQRHLRQTVHGWHCVSCDDSNFSTKDQAEFHVRKKHESGKGMCCPVCNENFQGEKPNVLVSHVKKQHREYIPNLGLQPASNMI